MLLTSPFLHVACVLPFLSFPLASVSLICSTCWLLARPRIKCGIPLAIALQPFPLFLTAICKSKKARQLSMLRILASIECPHLNTFAHLRRNAGLIRFCGIEMVDDGRVKAYRSSNLRSKSTHGGEQSYNSVSTRLQLIEPGHTLPFLQLHICTQQEGGVSATERRASAECKSCLSPLKRLQKRKQ